MEANRQENQQMRQEMEEMEARNRALEEAQNKMKEDMQAQLAVIAVSFMRFIHYR